MDVVRPKEPVEEAEAVRLKAWTGVGMSVLVVGWCVERVCLLQLRWDPSLLKRFLRRRKSADADESTAIFPSVCASVLGRRLVQVHDESMERSNHFLMPPCDFCHCPHDSAT